MNCNDFDKIVNDLACYNLMDAGRKEQALSHINVCVLCAARLSEERLLSNSLSLAVNAETEQAPSHIKANLLAAFKEQSKSSVTIFAPVRNTKSPNYLWKWVLAAAAVFVIALLGFAAMRLAFQKQPQTQYEANIPSDVKETPTSNKNEDKHEETKKASPQITIKKNKVNNVRRSYAAKSLRRKSNAPSNENVKNEEVTSDFIALTYTGGTSLSNNKMIVRVNVPRATLIAMGLPLNAAQTEGYVKADLVVGDDGVAHAIRLVQDSSQTSETKEKTN